MSILDRELDGVGCYRLRAALKRAEKFVAECRWAILPQLPSLFLRFWHLRH